MRKNLVVSEKFRTFVVKKQMPFRGLGSAVSRARKCHFGGLEMPFVQLQKELTLVIV